MIALESLKDCLWGTREPEPAEALCAAVGKKNYPAAYAALRALTAPLSGRQARACLTDALSCTPKLFREILERCAPGEYANCVALKRRSERKELFFRVDGTILTLAAAMDRPEHAAILLEKGWDVNSCSPASIQAVYDACNGVNMGSGSITCCGEPISAADTCLVIERAVPLAAAILCGSLRTAELLLARADVKKLENPAVSRATVAALHGDTAQRWCLETVLETDRPAFGADTAKELLRKRAPDIAAIADLCTPDEFALRLSGQPCPRERLLAAAEALCPASFDAPANGRDEKLFLLLSRYPALKAERKVRDGMFNAILARLLSKQPCDALLERWKAACGEKRDVSNAESELLKELTRRKTREQREIFDKLRAGGSLCASAESAWFTECRNKRLLPVLLEYVDFYRTAVGISALAYCVVFTGDVRIVRKAAARGALRGERREELLAFCGATIAPALRALLLTLPEEQIGVASARSPGEDPGEWEECERMDRSGTLSTDCLPRMWEEPLPAGECEKRLRMAGWIGEGWWLPNYVLDGILYIDSFPAAACCGKNPELLRALLKSGCDMRERMTVRRYGGPGRLNGTPLCLAAAAGRTEQVRLLLDMGVDPNEDDAPERSVYDEGDIFGGFEVPRVVTPLYMAEENGHFETAELLRGRGGYAYPAR